ncbi:MAG: hypothetical protein PHE44_12840 [Proteiniphilum sp.]|nr:hypothetical protein [Proteiniphilum sp.]
MEDISRRFKKHTSDDKCENVQANIEESIHEALTIIAEGYNIKCYRWADIQIDEDKSESATEQASDEDLIDENDKKIEKE